MREPVSKEEIPKVLRLNGLPHLPDALPLALFTFDAAGVIADENQKAAALSGGIVGRPFTETCSFLAADGSRLEYSQTPLMEVLRTGQPVEMRELILQCEDGARLSVEVHASPVRDSDNQVIGGLLSVQDISARKIDDKRIRESKLYYQQILDALPVAVYITDVAGKITYSNGATGALAGESPVLGEDESRLSWRLFDLNGAEVSRDHWSTSVALKEQRPIVGPETIAERSNGSRVRFVPQPTPLFDSEGQLAGAVNLLVEVTQRHKEEILAARLAAIVASSDDAIISKTLDGYITSWNVGAARIFGFTAEEMIGQHITRIIPHDLQTEENSILARLRAGEHIDHFETVRTAKNGQRIDVSLTVSPIRDKAGRVIGASKVGRDISDRIQSEKLQRLLISELNHRVKNTLATVQSIANQTIYHSKSVKGFAASFGGRLQALARTHSLLTDTTWRGAELSAVIQDQLHFGGAGEDRISFSGPSVMLNAQAALHLGLVLHELVTNALKYGALSNLSGTIAIRWIVRRDDGGRQLLLQWEERDGPRVGKPKRRGFGTTLIERSLDAHNGAAVVRYESNGIICDITLPLAENELDGGSYNKSMLGALEIPRDKMQKESVSMRSSLVGKRVLVVDDEPLIAMDIIANLSDERCEVIGPAATIDRALALIEETQIDAALLDANLAGEPVDVLAAALVKRKIPFAFVSGYGRENLPEAFRDYELVRKPFQPQMLIDTVRRLIQPENNIVLLRLNV